MYDVTRRRQIHDGMRHQAALNAHRLRMPTVDEERRSDATGAAVLLDTMELLIDREDAETAGDGAPSSSSVTFDPEGDAVNSAIFDTIDEIEADEGIGRDGLYHLSDEDVRLLAEELYGEASVSADTRREEILRGWFKLRRQSPQSASYASLPAEDRAEWNPWYLRDLQRR